MSPWHSLAFLHRNSYRTPNRNAAAVLLRNVETLLDLNLLRNLVASFLWYRVTLPTGVGLRNVLCHLLALLLGDRGTLLLSIASIVTDIRIHGGALVLINCLVGCLHCCAALCVLHGGAELSVGSLVCWLALGGIARGALCLHLGSVGGLDLCLALTVRHCSTLGLKTCFFHSTGYGLYLVIVSCRFK